MILLLSIARSLQRTETSDPQTIQPPIELPPFSVSSSARWINGLWFTSLALSLSAALIAMLSKEWLSAFINYRPRSAHEYSLIRQARLEGLAKWHALHIIDLLPSILHLALLFFALGLTIYLGTLDTCISVVVSLIMGLALLLYVATTILGAIHTFSPFATQISVYVRYILATRFQTEDIQPHRLSVENTDLAECTTDIELRALVWLSENARDPTVRDGAYQALAGLRLSTFKPKTNYEGATMTTDRAYARARSVETVSGNDDELGIPAGADQSERYDLIASLFSILRNRLSRLLIRQPRQLALHQELNIVRYASALPRLARFLESSRSGEDIDGRATINIQAVCAAFL